MTSSYQQQQRERVEARHGPIHEIPVPASRDEAIKLAREDEDVFNALVDSGRLPAGLFAAADDERGGS